MRHQVRGELLYHMDNGGLAGGVRKAARNGPVEGRDAGRGDHLAREGHVVLPVARVEQIQKREYRVKGPGIVDSIRTEEGLQGRLPPRVDDVRD